MSTILVQTMSDVAISALQRAEDRAFLKALKLSIGQTSMQITIQSCVFGQVLIGIDNDSKKIMAVELGSSAEDLMRSFINRWSKTNMKEFFFIGNQKPDQDLVDDVLRAVNYGVVEPTLFKHLSIYGTIFQRKVLNGILQIPSGHTETYQQVADRIGENNAVRAIGNAVGSNTIAMIVPCHRVIRSNGELGGYRWGLDLKRQLLFREKSHLL